MNIQRLRGIHNAVDRKRPLGRKTALAPIPYRLQHALAERVFRRVAEFDRDRHIDRAIDLVHAQVFLINILIKIADFGDRLMGENTDDLRAIAEAQVLQSIIGLAEMRVDPLGKIENGKLVKRLEELFFELVELLFVRVGFDRTAEIIKTDLDHPKDKILFFQRGLRNDPHAAEVHGHRTEKFFALMQDMQVKIENFHQVRLGIGRIKILKNGADGVITHHMMQRGQGGPHEFFINTPSVFDRFDIAFGKRQMLQKIPLIICTAHFAREVDGPRGVLKDLYGFEAGKFREKPAAACVHEHEVALHLQKLEGYRDLLLGKLPRSLPFKESAEGLGIPFQDHLNIIVAGRPRVLQIF